MTTFKKRHAGASRRRRLVLVLFLLSFFAAMMLMVVHSQETLTVEADTDTATVAAATGDASPSEQFEDLIDLDDASSLTADTTTTATAQSTGAAREEKSAEGKTADGEDELEADTKIEELDEPEQDATQESNIVQKGPFIDLLGPTLLSLVLTGENTARFEQNLTNDALSGKTVVGLYFSAGELQECMLDSKKKTMIATILSS
jgi:hypothetical protein